MTEELDELKAIKKLLITSLLVSGVDAETLAKILGYKSKSSITNDFPVRRLQRIAGCVVVDKKQFDALMKELENITKDAKSTVIGKVRRRRR